MIKNGQQSYIDRFCSWIERRHNILYIAAVVIQIVGMIVAYRLYGIIYSSDSPSYIEPAKSFLAQGIMLQGGTPIFFRTPGFVLILAIIYKFTNMSDFAVVVVQSVMSIATGSFIHTTVKCVSKSRTLSLCAMFLWTACTLNYHYVCCILTESSFIFFFVLSILLGCKYLNSKRFLTAVFCFLSLMFTLLIRPSVMYLCIILVVLLLLAAILKKIEWKIVAAYACIFIIVYGGWSLRNYHYFGTPIFTSIRYISYYEYYAPETYRIVEKASSKEALNYMYGQLTAKYPNYNKLSDAEKMYAKADIGKQYVKKHMDAYIILNLRGLIFETLGFGKAAIDILPLSRTSKALLMLFSAALAPMVYLVYAAGFLRNIKRLKFIDWCILLINGYLMAGHAVLGYNRFRMSFFATCIIGAMICWRQELLISKQKGDCALNSTTES